VPLFDADALRQHRALVARMADRDSGALTELHQAHVSLLHGLVRRILADHEEVREVVQDTFVKAWNQANVYRPERGEVHAWLVFIARNLAIDRLRRRSRRAAAMAEFAKDTDDSEPAPQESTERRDLFEQTMTGLRPAQRQALELAFFRGCSQAEIAAEMNTPVGNVKNHLRRGLLKLRQIIQRHD